MAAGLLRRDVTRGESVALMLPTSRDFFVAFMGVLLAGGVPVPIYPPFRASQLEDHLRRQALILDNAHAGLLIATPATARPGRWLRSALPRLREVVTVAELGAGPPADLPRIEVSPSDVALVQYTSGSTGDPKGVVLTHANLVANIRAMGEAAEVNTADVFVSWLPLYHDMGLIGAWLGSLYFGYRMVVMPPTQFLVRPQDWLWALHRHRGTLSAAPNFAYEICATRIADAELEGLDLSAWRIASSGSEPVSPATVERFTARFGPHGLRPEAVMPVYGLAESTVGLAFTPPGRGPRVDRVARAPFQRDGTAQPAAPDAADAIAVVSAGGPLPGHEIRIVDPAGHELPDRREGDVEFRGPSSTAGYLRNPRATAALIAVGGGGWLRTGDRGYVADGEIFITGRSKDLIIRAGRHVFPYELEDIVASTPGVRRGGVAVFACADPTTGTERLVVVAETRAVDADERAELRKQIESRAVLRRAGARGSALAYAGWFWAWFGAGLLAAWALANLVPRAAVPRAVAGVARAFFALVGVRLAMRGRDQLPASRAVVALNHASYLDGIVALALLPPGARFVVKGELGRNPFLRRALVRLGVLFVERLDPKRGIEDTARLEAAVREGATLVVFPEGTNRRIPGLFPFRMGAFQIAARTGAPVVPGGIIGTRAVLRADQWFPRRAPIEVALAPPVVAEGDGWDAAVALRDRTRAAIAKLAHEHLVD